MTDACHSKPSRSQLKLLSSLKSANAGDSQSPWPFSSMSFAQPFLASRQACSLLHLTVIVPFTFVPALSSIVSSLYPPPPATGHVPCPTVTPLRATSSFPVKTLNYKREILCIKHVLIGSYPSGSQSVHFVVLGVTKKGHKNTFEWMGEFFLLYNCQNRCAPSCWHANF